MKVLKYINSLGAELEFTNTAPFLLNKMDTSNNVNIYDTKGMKQDGATYLGNTLDKRDITLEITVIGNTDEELINYKDKVNKIFNPKLQEGWLTYKDDVKERKVKCIVNKLPYFSVVNSSVNTCLVSLTANNPFWKELQEIKKDIALWIGNFRFNLIIPQSTGIIMGHRAPSLIVNVNNSGHVECGMKIIFKALATLTNPTLFNINTREFIKINKSMAAGETITITTDTGNKKITDNLNGVESNAYRYIDLNSTFLQLAVGDNIFRYNADTGLDNLECGIYYTPQYLGV